MCGSVQNVKCLAWDETGHFLATAGGSDVVVWDMDETALEEGNDNSIVCYGHGRNAKITALKFQANGNLLVSNIKMSSEWKLLTLMSIAVLSSPVSKVRCFFVKGSGKGHCFMACLTENLGVYIAHYAFLYGFTSLSCSVLLKGLG